MRLTTTMTQRSILSAIQSSYARLSGYQKQVATGIRINSPSDDPVGISRVLWLKHSIAQTEQYQANNDIASDEVNAASETVNNLLNSLLRVKEIAVYNASGIASRSQMDAGAREVEEILNNIVASSNTTINNKYMFAGFQTDTLPFVATYAGGFINAVNYFGDQGQRQVEVATGRRVTVNFAGSSAVAGSPGVFVDATAGVNVFNTLIQLRTDLFAGNVANIMNDEGALSQYTDYVQGLAGRLGVTGQELLNLRNSQDKELLYKGTLRADIEEADPYVAMSNMSNEQVAYQAALQVGSRIFSMSLFDFLK
jgi:flagellar hook-associated protein 3 FlgL